jgi:hypothetical protein
MGPIRKMTKAVQITMTSQGFRAMSGPIDRWRIRCLTQTDRIYSLLNAYCGLGRYGLNRGGLMLCPRSEAAVEMHLQRFSDFDADEKVRVMPWNHFDPFCMSATSIPEFVI